MIYAPPSERGAVPGRCRRFLRGYHSILNTLPEAGHWARDASIEVTIRGLDAAPPSRIIGLEGEHSGPIHNVNSIPVIFARGGGQFLRLKE